MRGGTSQPSRPSRLGSRQAARARQRLWQRVRYLRTAGIGALLAGAIIAFVLVLAAPSNSGATGQRQATTPQSGPRWVALASTSPAAVLSAVRATRNFQDIYNAPQTLLGQALHQGTLGTPVLVHAYHPTPGMTDVWVIPVLEANAPGSHIVALLDFAYDSAHQQIHPLTFAGPFVPTDPEYGQPFPRVTPAHAAALVAGARPQAGVPGVQPQLVYFPANQDAISGPHATAWSGGGQFPDLAIWLMPGAGGNDYLAGLDGKVYTASQLPLAPAAGA